MEDRLNPCNYNLLRAAAAVRIQPRRSFQISRLSSSVGIHCELLGRAIGCDHPIPLQGKKGKALCVEGYSLPYLRCRPSLAVECRDNLVSSLAFGLHLSHSVQ